MGQNWVIVLVFVLLGKGEGDRAKSCERILL